MVSTTKSIRLKDQKMSKHLTLLLSIILFTVGCSAPTNELETAKTNLAELKSSKKDLDGQIKELEALIKKLDTTVKEDKRILVVTKSPEKKEFKHYIQIPGRADSRQNIVVSAEAMGNITSIDKEEGDMVRKGQVIARIKSDVLGNQISELKTRLELATELFEKQKRLWDKKIGSEVQYLQAKSNKESLEKNIAALQAQQSNSIITAPISGYLDQIFVRRGQLVNMGTPAARIVDLNHIEIEVEVSEAYIGSFKQGDKAFIKFPSIDETYEAPIKTIGQVVNPDDRTFMVEIDLSNKNGLIKPNVLANVRIATYENPETIVLPTSIVQQGKNDSYVFVVEKNGSETFAKKRTVKVGMTYRGQSEILEGISPDDQVITVGGRNVADGDPIRIKQ